MTNYFSKNLKYLRKKNNIDQQVMAEDLGVAQSTLSCWENGLRTPDFDMVANIAKYLNIHEDFITNDLTNIDTVHFDDNRIANLLYNKVKVLPKEKQKMILNVTEAVMKDIDEQLDNK